MSISPQRVQSPFASRKSVLDPARVSATHAESSSPAQIAQPSLALRALTGWEEEFIERRRDEQNTARLCNEVLARCLSAPGIEPSEQTLASVRSLLVAERDRGLVELRSMSLGPEVSLQTPCAQCGVPNSLNFSLDALDTNFGVPSGPVVCALEGGGSAELRLPTAGDQEALIDAQLTTPAERKSWLLGRVLLRYRDQTSELDANFARGLPMRERNQLEAALDAVLPDFDFRMAANCCACQAELLLPFDVSVFFLAS